MILRLLLSFARKACSLEWHRGAGHPVLAEGLVLARLQVFDILSQARGKHREPHGILGRLCTQPGTSHLPPAAPPALSKGEEAQ